MCSLNATLITQVGRLQLRSAFVELETLSASGKSPTLFSKIACIQCSFLTVRGKENNTMKLGVKLPIAFAIALGLLFASSLFGLFRLNSAVATYAQDVLRAVAAHRQVAEVGSDFSTAIQEWKNVLLRGKDEKKRDDFWNAHVNKMKAVREGLQTLAPLLVDDPTKAMVADLAREIGVAQERYVKAFAAYKAADYDFSAGDKAASGADRLTAKLLGDLKTQLSKAEQAISASASSGAERASTIAYSLMVSVTLLSLAGAVWLSRQIVGPLRQAVAIADRVAHGDLSVTIARGGKDEIGALLNSLGDMQVNLVKLVNHVRQGSESVATASAEIAQGNHDLSARTEQQASVLEETASSMEELSSAVRQNADSARTSNQLAHSASTVAIQGGQVVSQVVQTMKGINESSRKIADIISVIDGIAFQTNILALNAAVEAARAGEQGRGFAVVASEVRSLAGRSADAAKEIKSLINASVERVEQGNVLVEQAGQTMVEVVTAIRRVTDIMGEISAASNEQATGVAQIGEAVTRMDQGTQQNAALVEQMAAAASSLKGQADDLVRVVGNFKLGHSGSVAVARLN